MKHQLALVGAAICAFVLIPPRALATSQDPDAILIDGQVHALHTNPLTPLLRTNPQLLPKPQVMCSCNGRGYQAKWDISTGKLVLRSVYVAFRASNSKDTELRDVIKEAFPDSTEIVASWYSGTLLVPFGRVLEYVHMGYASTYERYALISVRDGTVIRTLHLSADDFSRFRDAQFEAYLRSPQYEQDAKPLRESSPTSSEAFIRDFLRRAATEYYLSLPVSQ